MIRLAYISFLLFLSALSGRAQILAQDTVRQQDWPTGVPMDDETIEWRQDIYRELDLTKQRNAGLYSDSFQEDETTGLFARIFEVALEGKIKLYKYDIDGNERLIKRNQTDIKHILDDFHIAYTCKGNTVSVNKSDIPFAEVTVFYLKEAIYYDVINSSCSTRVLALCPVIVMEDEFSDEPVRYPLFWVKYSELERYLHSTYTIPEYRNLAGKMPMDEYFALNLYEGDVYKVYNAFGNAMSTEINNNTLLHAERAKIKQNFEKIQKTTYNIYYNDKKETQKAEVSKPEKVKTKHIWIFPWQKKKMKEAEKKEEDKESENQKSSK